MQRDPEAPGTGVVKCQDIQRPQQECRGDDARREPRCQRDDAVPVLLVERACPPDMDRHGIFAARQDQRHAERGGDQADDHAGDRHRDRIEPAPPTQCQYDRHRTKAAGKGDQLAGDAAQERQGTEAERQRQLRTRGDAEGRGIGDRIAQHPLQQRTGKTERSTGDQRDRGAGQKAVPQQDRIEGGSGRRVPGDLRAERQEQDERGDAGGAERGCRNKAGQAGRHVQWETSRSGHGKILRPGNRQTGLPPAEPRRD